MLRNNVTKRKLQLDPNSRSPLWLDIAAVASVILGVAEAVVGRGSSALLANAVGMLDNSTYALDSVAARNEHNRKRNHIIRRIAGSLICGASFYVGANAVFDLVTNHMESVPIITAWFAIAATILNGIFVIG